MANNNIIDNRNVVPYNKYLLLKYNCHINVEICTSLKSVKYIFKYVYKGYDCADIKIYYNNEIEHFVNTKYVIESEAAWRLYEYKMNDKSDTIIRLPIHLPNRQMILYEEGNEENIRLDKNTKLTAWFELNKNDERAKQYYYTE
ncbi:MAG: hypothetical protein RR538_09755, partial [Erysipelotrichaceae bacterium]